MRKMLLVTAVAAAAALFAGDGVAGGVNLAWNASPTPAVTYVLYAHTNDLTATNLSSAIVRLNIGTNLTATVEALKAGQWCFVATAKLNGVESDPSNSLIVEVPEPPSNMRTVVLQYSGTLTNFYDVGFFRLRLP
jgi:hypothetical protein